MMKKLLLFIFLTFSALSYSQNLTQTYVDRCTGEVKVFSVPINGKTVVVFYNRSQTFTASQFQDGTLRSWLEETYLWWASLNPCSTAQTNVVTTQAVTQQTAQQATQAATNTASSISSPTENTKSEETKLEEPKSEKEEQIKEEKEESKEDEEENKKEEEKEEEEEKKEKKKKAKQLSPPIITANVISMQGLDGTYSYASTFGVSRSSLMGDKTYGLNSMVWSNLQQFMLTANFSKVHINKEGRVSRVYSASLGGAKMFTTVMGMMNHSVVFLGKKGSASGLALGSNLTYLEFNIKNKEIDFDELLVGSSITGFYTKPIPYNRFTFSPMVAVSSAFMSYEVFNTEVVWNKDLIIIGGLSTTFNITKRFAANLGVNVVGSTNPTFPIIMSYTIGSRFSF
jgi:hypothetical protein